MLDIINLFFICFIEHMDMIEMGLEIRIERIILKGWKKGNVNDG